MKNDCLLTSPEFVKQVTTIGDNINGSAMQFAIREAQEVGLQAIIGTRMLKKLKRLVVDNTIMEEENTPYYNLLSKAQYFLAYAVITELVIPLAYKIDNAGVVRTKDEHIEVVGSDELEKVINFYDNKAGHYRYMLQQFILDHLNILPEITENQCKEIHATLHSAANSSIWLGGARGKGYGYKLREKYDHK